MFTSKCYQCCNSGFNCNANWQPSTERDWSFNDIRGHRLLEQEVTASFSTRTKPRAYIGTTDVKANSATGNFMKFIQS